MTKWQYKGTKKRKIQVWYSIAPWGWPSHPPRWGDGKMSSSRTDWRLTGCHTVIDINSCLKVSLLIMLWFVNLNRINEYYYQLWMTCWTMNIQATMRQWSRGGTSTGFSFSHSLSMSVVLFSTTLSSVTIFSCRLATCVWIDASLRLMISLNAPHSPSMLSLYSQEVGNWKRWRSKILWPSLYMST